MTIVFYFDNYIDIVIYTTILYRSNYIFGDGDEKMSHANRIFANFKYGIGLWREYKIYQFFAI